MHFLTKKISHIKFSLLKRNKSQIALVGVMLVCAFFIPIFASAKVYTPTPQTKSIENDASGQNSNQGGGVNNNVPFQQQSEFTKEDPTANINNLSQLPAGNQSGVEVNIQKQAKAFFSFFGDVYKSVINFTSSVVKSVWDWIFPPVKEVKYNDHVSIKGTKTFINITKENLKKIEAVDPGQQLLKNINNTKYHVTITTAEHVSGDQTTVAEGYSWIDAVKPKSYLYDKYHNIITDESNRPIEGTGKGVDAIVEYNPNETLKDEKALNCEKNRDVTNDAILFHELTHASHMMHGVAEMTPIGDNWTTEEERITELTGHPNEADYLKANGFNYHRIDHACTMANN